MTAGSALREAREARGLTLREVAQTTAIRRDYLQALEDGQLDRLPEATLVRSYLRRYARELGLHPAPLLAEIDRLIQPALPEPEALPLDEAALQKDPAPLLGTGRMALIAALLGLLLLVGVLLLRRQAPAAVVSARPVPAVPVQPGLPPPVPQPPSPPPTLPQSTVRLSVQSFPDGAQVYLDNRNLGPAPVRSFPVEARGKAQLRVEAAGRTPLKQTIDLRRSRNLRATLPPDSAGAGDQQPSVLADLNTGVRIFTPLPPPVSVPAVPTSAGAGVRVTFTGSSWTRVTDRADRGLYEGTPPPGSVKAFPAGVTVHAGNAAVVRVSVGSKPEQAMGEAGQVVTRRY